MASGQPQVCSVVNEARLLITRLQDRDKTADKLLVRVSELNEKINGMREYQEDIQEMAVCSSAQPRSALVHSLQQENRQIRFLQEENRQLKMSLEEHQAALELIMNRHRRLVMRMAEYMKTNNVLEALPLSNPGQGTSEQGKEPPAIIREYSQVFNEALRHGEIASNRDQQELSRLSTENSVLRQLLRIGSGNDPRMCKLFSLFVKEQAARNADLHWSMDEEDEDDSSTPVDHDPNGRIPNLTNGQLSPEKEDTIAAAAAPQTVRKSSVTTKSSKVTPLSTKDTSKQATELIPDNGINGNVDSPPADPVNDHKAKNKTVSPNKPPADRKSSTGSVKSVAAKLTGAGNKSSPTNTNDTKTNTIRRSSIEAKKPASTPAVNASAPSHAGQTVGGKLTAFVKTPFGKKKPTEQSQTATTVTNSNNTPTKKTPTAAVS